MAQRSSGIITKSVVCGFLLLAIALVFGQTVNHEFINLDDDRYVYDNPHITHGVTPDAIAWPLTHSHESNWHPLTSFSHMLDCQCYGLWAGGHHLTNVLLHAATAILFFLVLSEMTGALWPSALAAAVFAIHPLRVESVAWVAERKDVLCGLFFMLTVAAYVGYSRRPFSVARYLAVVVLFAMGLMCKPMLVTLPLVLLLLDYWPLGRLAGRDDPGREPGSAGVERLSAWRLVAEKVPLLALTATSCVVTVWAQHEALSANELMPLSWRIANALVSLVAYLGQLFYPAGLAVLYPHQGSDVPTWQIVGASFVLIALFLGVLAGRRRYPWLLVGWLWYAGMLVPVIGLVQVGSQAMADRYTYLPQIGVTISIVWMGACLCRSLPYRHWACGVASVLVAVLLISCAWRQASHWRNSETLFVHTLACTSNNAMIHVNYGVYLQGQGRTDEAIRQYEEAIAIQPDYSEAHNDLGAAMLAKGRLDDAVTQFWTAVRTNPEAAVPYDNLGMGLVGQGRPGEAIEYFEKSLKIRPDYLRGRNNLGLAVQQLGRLDEAIVHFQKALEIDPQCAESYNNLGNALFRKGRIDDAIANYLKAVELQPKLVVAQSNLGLAFQGKGQIEQATAYYRKALDLDPDYPEAHNGLGLILHNRGKLDEAIDHYQKAVKVKPNYAEAQSNLATALSQKGRVDDAMPHWQKALEAKPDHVMAHNNLGNALSAKGRFDEAIVHYRKVLEIQPDLFDTHHNLGLALAACGRLDEAIAEYRKVLELRPDHDKAHRSLGNVLQRQGKPAEALAEWREGLRARPGDVRLLNQIARVLATSPDKSIRNGDEAIALARRAVQLTGENEPAIMDTLAAAYAEANRFPEAIEVARRAAAMAAARGNAALAEVLRSRIRLYEAGSAMRDTR